MSFPQLGYPQFLGAPHDLYGSERPGSAREGAPEGGVGSPAAAAAAAAAVGSMLGVYGSPWAHNYSAFLPYGGGADLSLLTQMGSQYELKESPGSHAASLPVHAAAAQGFYPYAQYPYADPSRSKTATRETTSTLKAWLQEHQKNPYPTKGEKIMLAIITRMTLTQVSTWFANARRRLKKENKVTWGRSAEDRDGRIFSSDNEDEHEHGKAGSDGEDEDEDEEIDLETVDTESRPEELRRGEEKEEEQEEREGAGAGEGGRPGGGSESDRTLPAAAQRPAGGQECQRAPQSKPKIWSLAETAAAPDSAHRPFQHPGAFAQQQQQQQHAALASAAAAAHPALLPAHGIYTCQIGKLHSWANAALLNANSILNMRSLLGGAPGAHAALHDPRPAAARPGNSGTEGDGEEEEQGEEEEEEEEEEGSDVESIGGSSPRALDEQSERRRDSLQSPFQLITDRSHGGTTSQRVLATTL